MEIKCLHHNLPLKIEERMLTLLGVEYPATVGICPKCREVYVNRMLNPSGSNFRIGNQIYQYHEKLSVAFPPQFPALKEKSELPIKSPGIPSNSISSKEGKRQEKEKRKRETKEAAIQARIAKDRKKIASNPNRVYFVGCAVFKDKIPEKCPADGEELTNVKWAAFIVNGSRYQGEAYCCLRCKTAYLEKQMEETINNQIQQRKIEERQEKEKKNQRELERAKKEEEIRILKIREEIQSGEWEVYPVQNVVFGESIPIRCPGDGDVLIDVRCASFVIDKTKIKAHAHCCIRCSTAYLSRQMEKKINEQIDAERNTRGKNPASRSRKNDSSVKLIIPDLFRQIPVLESEQNKCPFCSQSLSKLVDIQYCISLDENSTEVRCAMIWGCPKCKAGFADRQQLDALKGYCKGKQVKTILPSKYKDAESMMNAAKHTPAKEKTRQMPFENLSNQIVNLSKESKVVQVFAQKCHCQKCEEKYKRITTVNRTAVVETFVGTTEQINVMFCQGCGQYFINIDMLKSYKSLYGGVLLEYRIQRGVSADQYAWLNFAQDTVLSRCGYNAKENTPVEYRQAILRYILDSGKATKYYVIEKISEFISIRHRRTELVGACERWQEDIDFVKSYRIQEQKKVYDLDFALAPHLRKK